MLHHNTVVHSVWTEDNSRLALACTQQDSKGCNSCKHLTCSLSEVELDCSIALNVVSCIVHDAHNQQSQHDLQTSCMGTTCHAKLHSSISVHPSIPASGLPKLGSDTQIGHKDAYSTLNDVRFT